MVDKYCPFLRSWLCDFYTRMSEPFRCIKVIPLNKVSPLVILFWYCYLLRSTNHSGSNACRLHLVHIFLLSHNSLVFKRIDLVVYITLQFVLVKPISSKREREAPLSWYTPRMLDDMFYIWCEATNKFSFDQILSVLFSNLLKNFVIFYRSLHIIESTPITVKTFFHTCI